jgi:uncharacterized protein YkwD
MTNHRLLSTLLAVVATLLFVVPTASAAQSSTQAVLGQINQVRAAHGLRPVALVYGLQRAARVHSSDMVARDYFLHESGPGGEAFSRRIGRFWHPNAAGVSIGEILAWGSGTFASPAAAVRGWLNSPPHRAILLSPRFTLVGIGVAHGRFLGHSGAAVYTADFGRL